MHKAEGVMRSGSQYVVLHDDDSRATTVTTQGEERTRKVGEAPFDIVSVR